jgi:hypothetical protein
MELSDQEKINKANKAYQRNLVIRQIEEKLTLTQIKEPNHKYVQSFQHLINIVNTAIENAGDTIDECDIETRHQYYYDFIYKQPFCDQYTWLIKNERPDLLMRNVFVDELLTFTNTNKFCGKTYGKVFIVVPEHLKDK